jgi:catalase
MARSSRTKAATADFEEQQKRRGAGGETHQTADDGRADYAAGTRISDDQNTLRQGARGPVLIEDFHFREKISHFDHERIPKRACEAQGHEIAL